MPKNSELHGAPPLDPRRGFAPGPHAKVTPNLIALLYLIANTLSPPLQLLKTVPRGLHVTCKSDDDADFFLPSPQKNVLAHYVTPPSFLAFRPPRS